MYWPSGVPRIYAYSGSDSLEKDTEDDSGHDQASHSSDEVDNQGRKPGNDHPTRAEGEHGTTVLDLRVARLDHIFVTISPSCLTIWSGRVRVSILSATRKLT